CIDVNTTSSVVRGLTINVLNIRVDQFLNIPYAEPPVGSLRISKPTRLKRVTHVIGTNTTKSIVMLWIYGGGLSSGSIFDTQYNGSVLATHDVVFVSTNYRLGPFG
ncbi:unnamed protein product, partial [Oppiella nova]